MRLKKHLKIDFDNIEKVYFPYYFLLNPQSADQDVKCVGFAHNINHFGEVCN